MNVLLVAAGSAMGGVLRYLISTWVRVGGGFPWVTLSINVAGSLILGLVSGLIARHWGGTNEGVRAFAVVGFCGGFTTFSTFSNETFRLIENGQGLSAFVYVLASVLAGLAAVALGALIAKGA